MGRKNKSGKKRAKKLDADLDGPVDGYELSESDDGLETEDKIMLERAKHGRLIQDNDSEEEVFRIHSSSDEEQDNYENEDEEKSDGDDQYYGTGVGSDLDSDIEGKADSDGDLPNDKAWGKRKQKYYNTDYVDQDYGGFGKDEEEDALMEEKEADALQRRLLSHLEGTDFTLGFLDKVEKKKSEIAEKVELHSEKEKIQTDFSQLSKQEKIQLLKQESPELFEFVDELEARHNFICDTIDPILKMVEDGKIPSCKVTECLQVQKEIISRYCLNISYYLYLRSMKVPRIENHPILKRIYTLSKVVGEFDTVNKELLNEQINRLLELKKANKRIPIFEEEPEPQPKNRAERRKKQLKILEQKKMMEQLLEEKKKALGIGQSLMPEEIPRDKPAKEVRFVEPSDESDSEDEDKEDEEPMMTNGGEEDKVEKRGINFQIAKNKGLTPKRKKEQRNPRVKHRNKYKKAKMRRRGQVREVRKELERYGGEISGIKAYVSKSIKFK